MTHLTPSEIVDALDGTLAPARQAHARECDACRNDVDALGRLLAQTRGVDVPEPSPLFWERFSARVQAAIAAERLERPRRSWFEWPVLAPIASLALVLLVLGAAIARQPITAVQPDMAVIATSNDLDDATIEAVWTLAFDLIGADSDVLDGGFTVAPGSAERAAVELSSDEQHELIRLIQEELGKSGG